MGCVDSARRPQRILAVGAHPDDLEIGCGGTLAKLCDMGASIRALVLSRGERGLPAGSNLSRLDETREALGRIGVDDVVFGDFPDTRFGDYLPELIEFLERQIADLDPDRLYTMAGRDRHQDHRAVHEASMVAARGCTQVFLYETPSCGTAFVPIYFEEVSPWFDAKLEAVRCHESQRRRSYMAADYLRSLATVRGVQGGCRLAEGYEVMRMVAA